MVQIRLFGGIDVWVDAAPIPRLRSKKSRWLLALLALRQGRPISRAVIAAILWPDQESATTRAYLSQTLTEIRHALGSFSGCLESPDPQNILLSQEDVWVDATEFDRLIERDALKALELAVAPLLEGCDEEWAIEARQSWDEKMIGALETLAEESPVRDAARYYARVVAIDPYRESARRSLMRALFESGDEAGAIRVYREFKMLLHRELNASPSAATEALFKEIRKGSVRPPNPVNPPNYRLPSPLTSLFGREEDLERVREYLLTGRLVTLTGPGGSGKTRLSIEAGRRMLPNYSHGVWFVDLSALQTADQVAPTLAKVLRKRDRPGRDVLSALTEDLADNELLIVLDNCEHLVAECARVASILLSACPNLSILATSRESLRIPGEWTYFVHSLSVPPSHQREVAECARYASVLLFEDRADRARPGFKVASENVADVVSICRRLDGIPLAIELAAARLRAVPLSELKSQIEDRFFALGEKTGGVAPRHQTLRSLIDWSYDLLAPNEKKLLARLSVFSGGANLESVQAIYGDTPEDCRHTIVLLISLIDKSLVLFDESTGEGRYRMLETIRQYAKERLDESGETDTIRDRHCDYFLAVTQAVIEGLDNPLAPRWPDVCERERGNLRLVVARVAERAGEEPHTDLGSRLSSRLKELGYVTEARILSQHKDASSSSRASQFSQLDTLHYVAELARATGDIEEHQRYLEAIIASGIDSPTHVGIAAWRLGYVHLATHLDNHRAKECFETAIQLFGDSELEDVSRAKINLAVALSRLGDVEGALTPLLEAVEHCEAHGYLNTLEIGLRCLGLAYYRLGQLDRGISKINSALAISRSLGYSRNQFDSLMSLGQILLDTNPEASLEAHREAWDVWRSWPDRPAEPLLHLRLIGALSCVGQITEARDILEREFPSGFRQYSQGIITIAFQALHLLVREEGHPEEASRLLGFARAVRRSMVDIPPAGELGQWQLWSSRLGNALGERRFKAAFEFGELMNIDAATILVSSLPRQSLLLQELALP